MLLGRSLESNSTNTSRVGVCTGVSAGVYVDRRVRLCCVCRFVSLCEQGTKSSAAGMSVADVCGSMCEEFGAGLSGCEFTSLCKAASEGTATGTCTAACVLAQG